MKIAVACSGTTISGHFGHCEDFMFFDCENGKIVSEQQIPNPGHRPGFLPNFLGDHGAEVIIAGGMGGGAVDIFNERKIEVVVGASGDARTAVEAYLRGELKSTGAVCHEHQHADECGEPQNYITDQKKNRTTGRQSAASRFFICPVLLPEG